MLEFVTCKTIPQKKILICVSHGACTTWSTSYSTVWLTIIPKKTEYVGRLGRVVECYVVFFSHKVP